jgi:hypothetical protein
MAECAAMSAVQRAAAVAVALLVVVVVGVLLLSGTDGPIGRGPDSSPAASPTVASPTAAATATPSPAATRDPTATPDADVLATLAEIEEQVRAIRGLPAPDIRPPEILSRQELAVEIRAIFDAEYPQEDRERDNFVVRAFGLLGPDEDIAELQLELLTDQVLGFYNTEDQRMVVVSDTGLDAEAKLTYAHEYTHALQDAAFGLDALETDAVGEDDRGLARVALIEGDATVTMLAWALRHLTQEELIQVGQAPVPDTANVPDWMMRQLMFPYVEGQGWVLQLMEATGGDPFAPDYTAVDAAFADPPDSTAQILDVQKWYDRVLPEPIELPDLAATLGSDWEEVDATSIGEATTRIILEHFGVLGPEASEAAAGWTGDRAVVVRGPDDAFALAWRTSWESEDDAAEFASAYEAVVDALDFPAAAGRDGDTVLVVHASDMDLLRRTIEAAR